MKKIKKISCLIALSCFLPLAPVEASEPTHDDLVYKVSCLTRIGRCAFPSFSPDGKTIAFVSTLSGTPQLWTVPIEGGWPTQITNLDDTVIGEEWSPTSDWLSMLLQAGGIDRPFYTVRSDGSQLKLMVPGVKYSSALAGWTPDGKHVLLSSSYPEGKAECAYLADPISGSIKPLAPVPVEGILEDVSADGHYAVVVKWGARGDSDIYRVDTKTGSKTLLTPHSDISDYTCGSLNRSRIRISPDGQAVYFLTNKDRGNDEYVFARVKIGADSAPLPMEVLCEHPGATVEGFSIDREGRNAFVCWKKDACSFEHLDLATGARKPLPDSPQQHCFEMELSPDSSHLALDLCGPVAPHDVWLFDTKTGQYRQLTHSPHAGIKLADLVSPEKVTFKAQDGKELYGWLYRPKNQSGPAPYVVSLSFSGTYWTFEFQSLLSQGIGVFCPRIRELDIVANKDVNAIASGVAIENEKQDIKSSVDYLVSNKIADPKRVGIYGQSHAGRLAVLGAIEYPNLFAACEEDFGIMNYFSYFRGKSKTPDYLPHVKGLEPEALETALHKLSVIERIDRLQAPILVQTGSKDSNVSPAQQDEVVAALKKNGSDVQYIRYDDEGHGFFKTKTQVDATVATVEFFVKNLKNEAEVNRAANR